ncbi:MAG: Toprim-like [Mucilaginibacter sp.]|nr:Toprim-like [Mucilaginibacter sp.]
MPFGVFNFAFELLDVNLILCMMDFSKHGLTPARIREMDMVDYLASLGYEPAKPSRNGVDFYYLSPLRNEGDPSFHVNRKKNCWYDHGLGAGGNLVEFALRYFRCTAEDLPDKFGIDFSFHQTHERSFNPHWEMDETETKITITGERPLWSYPLKNYLHERHIPVAVAERFCKEVSYESNGHSFYAIGFKNDAGGYELRNKIFKQSSSPKDITTISNGAKTVQVFEGFFDFLTYKTLHPELPEKAFDFVVLNGVSLFERARPFMEQHEAIGLWLDRDTTGMSYTKYALSLNKNYHDESVLYPKHKDLNDWLGNKGIVLKKQLKHKIN